MAQFLELLSQQQPWCPEYGIFKHASDANNNTKEIKTMKKSILIIAAAASITLLGTQAFACYWDGYWGGPMGGPTAMVNGGNYQGFYTKTAQIRQDLAAKQGEHNALLATANPDPQRSADLSREVTILHDKLMAEASSFNLPAPNTGTYGHMNGYAMMGGCW